MIIINGNEKNKAIKEFQYLWHVDNKDWLSNRKNSWKNLLQDYFYDCAASELKRYKTYYLEGKRDSYIAGVILFLLTPFDSVDTVRKFTFSPAFSEPERIMGEFFNMAAASRIRVDLLRPHVVFYAEGLLGSKYEVIEIQDATNAIKVASPDPSLWAGAYFSHTKGFFQNRDLEYSPVIDLLDYFISILKFASDPKFLFRKDMETLITIIESEYAETDPRPIAQEFLRSLRLRKDEILESWNKNSHLFK